MLFCKNIKYNMKKPYDERDFTYNADIKELTIISRDPGLNSYYLIDIINDYKEKDLKVLCINGIDLGEDEHDKVLQLAEVIQHTDSLTSLSLSGCSLGCYGSIPYITLALSEDITPKLNVINTSYFETIMLSGISTSVFGALFAFSGWSISAYATVASLLLPVITGTKITYHSNFGNKSLKTLDLSDNNLTDIDLESITYMLSHNQSLKTLDLSGNKITDKMIDLLLSAIGGRENPFFKLIFKANDVSSPTKLEEIQFSTTVKPVIEFIQRKYHTKNKELSVEDIKYIKTFNALSDKVLRDSCIQLSLTKGETEEVIKNMNDLIYENPLFLKGICKEIHLKEETTSSTVKDFNSDIFNSIFSYVGDSTYEEARTSVGEDSNIDFGI